MARPGPQAYAKRQREQAKKDKRRAKEEIKALRKAAKATSEELDPTETVTVENEQEPGSRGDAGI